MNIGMFRAISGCLVQQERLSTTSANLANTGTIGYKPSRLSLKATNNVAQVDEKAIDFSEGTRQNTYQKLDLALEGEGFFVVETSQGSAYTRKGNFTLNQDGTLVTQEGLAVLGQNGIIQVQGNELTVAGDGTILVDGLEVNKLRLATFPKPYPFSTNSGSLFFLQNQGIKEQPAQGTIVQQGQLELSNSNLMREMTQLIEISTNYESCQKVIQTVDEMDQKIINETIKV